MNPIDRAKLLIDLQTRRQDNFGLATLNTPVSPSHPVVAQPDHATTDSEVFSSLNQRANQNILDTVSELQHARLNAEELDRVDPTLAALTAQIYGSPTLPKSKDTLVIDGVATEIRDVSEPDHKFNDH